MKKYRFIIQCCLVKQKKIIERGWCGFSIADKNWFKLKSTLFSWAISVSNVYKRQRCLIFITLGQRPKEIESHITTACKAGFYIHIMRNSSIFFCPAFQADVGSCTFFRRSLTMRLWKFWLFKSVASNKISVVYSALPEFKTLTKRHWLINVPCFF